MLLRRRMMGKSKPYDAEIEYLEGDGNQYILLGIYENARVVFTAQANALTSKTQVCLTASATNKQCTWAGVIASGKWGLGTSSGMYANIDGTTKVTADLTFNTYTVSGTMNNVSVSRTATVQTQQKGEWMLFSVSGTEKFAGKIFDAKFFQNDVMVRDLIPVRIGQVGYMYDKVSGQLFGNSGSGNFTLGQDVND